MTDESKDILDLCRLNLMEERVSDSPAPDRDETLAAIDFKRRQIVTRICPATLAPGAMERHLAENTAADGVYPWTESPLHGIYEATQAKGGTSEDHKETTTNGRGVRRRAVPTLSGAPVLPGESGGVVVECGVVS